MYPDAKFVVHGTGDTPNIYTDLRDIGRWVARIINDPRTLNKYVVTINEVTTDAEILAVAEDIFGEKAVVEQVSVCGLVSLHVVQARESPLMRMIGD